MDIEAVIRTIESTTREAEEYGIAVAADMPTTMKIDITRIITVETPVIEGGEEGVPHAVDGREADHTCDTMMTGGPTV